MRSAEILPTVPCYTALINACAVAGSPSHAEYWFTRMIDAKVAPNVITYNAVLDSFGKVGDPEGAVRWQRIMQDSNLQPTELTFSSLISSAAKSRNKAAAVAHLEEMLTTSLQPNLVCFNAVIHACSRHGEEAKKWLAKLRECKLQPDEVTFTSLIDGCAKRSKPKQAAEWLRTMVVEELSPSVECYTAVIDSCASRGDIDQAAEWIEDMYDRQILPDAKAYNCVINAAAKASTSDQAVLWLDRMQNSSVPPTKVSYTAVIDACVKEGKLGLASSYFQRMMDEGSIPDMGDLSKADEHLQLAKSLDLVPDATCYNAFLAGCAQRGDLAKGASILEKMKEERVKPNLVSYNTMLKACRKAGDVSAALHWLQEIDSASLQRDMISWNCAIGACAAASPIASAKAEQLFRQFVESGLKPDGILLRTLTAAVGPERRRSKKTSLSRLLEMELAICADRRSLLRLRLQLAAECNDGMLCRKVILAVPAGLSLVADLTHYIYRYFKLEPIQPLAISVEGFGLLPAQRLEDVLRDGPDQKLQRPRRPFQRKLFRTEKTNYQHCLPALNIVKQKSVSTKPTRQKTRLQLNSGGWCDPSVKYRSFEVISYPDRRIERAPLPGEVIRYRLSHDGVLTDFQVAQCVGAGMAAGVSQVTLQSHGEMWSSPVESLRDVHLGTTSMVDHSAVKPIAQDMEEKRSRQLSTNDRITSPAPVLDKRKAEQLECAIRRQFEFYFGDVNYPRDNFLQSQADEEGWTPLRLVAKFNRVRELTFDFDLITSCLAKSFIVELSECKEYVRRTPTEKEGHMERIYFEEGVYL
eukprot:symbB.v1.2.032713.t2/scaffold3962.1/size79057/7